MSDVITTTEEQMVVVVSDSTAVVETTTQSIVVAEGTTGPQGPQGPQGIQGPAGANGSGDKTYSQPFTTASSVVVNHNLGKYPAVSVVDSAGDQCEGDVVHQTANSLTVTFSAPFSGTVYCN